MNIPHPIITLTTDFGTSDAYVGIMKGVILGINPNAQVVDITHAIPPQDVHEAAFSIHSAHRYFPTGTIHTVVVDPGVGSHRRAIVCQTDSAFFVCPDNGILSYIVQGTETACLPYRSVTIENPVYLLPQVSNTFHGRDIFAPVAAHLSLGVPLASIGAPIHDVVQLPIPTLNISGDTLTGQIVKIDGFGNAITNISEEVLALFLTTGTRLESALTGERDTYEIRAGIARLKRLNRAYAEAEVGEPLAIIGSFGLLEIAVNGGSAEARLGLKRGDAIVIQRFV